MSDIILHHYELSPFSEKIRRVLAFKAVPWRSVITPMQLPKDDLTALTGAYRRAPVLQIGADIYCDSALIARRLEHLFPQPALLPDGLAAAAAVWEDWADNRLVHQVTPAVVAGLLDAFPAGFFTDREKMTPKWSRAAFIEAAPQGLIDTRIALDWLAAHLGRNKFLLGDSFTLADAACFNPVGFLRNVPSLAEEVTSRPALVAWLGRIDNFGPGVVRAMRSGEALEMASAAEPEDIAGESIATEHYQVGDAVSVVADDYGTETLSAKLVRIRSGDITVLRQDQQLGTIAVHYPRAGYRVTRAATIAA